MKNERHELEHERPRLGHTVSTIAAMP
jgi:hypothetical protein